jgi:RPE1 domain-containing protein
MQDKKYYSIGEVTKILNIHSHQLRYLESILPNISIHKIRNRRYYTSQDIEYLKTQMITKNRLLAKLAYAQGFEGDASPRTAAYSSVREDSSTASLSKLPAELEFCKRSNVSIELEPPLELLGNQINKIDCLIKNFYELSLTIQQILSGSLHYEEPLCGNEVIQESD